MSRLFLYSESFVLLPERVEHALTEHQLRLMRELKGKQKTKRNITKGHEKMARTETFKKWHFPSLKAYGGPPEKGIGFCISQMVSYLATCWEEGPELMTVM